MRQKKAKAVALSLTDYINGIPTLNDADLSRLNALLEKHMKSRRDTTLQPRESELLKIINTGLPEKKQRRLRKLSAKSVDNLSEQDRSELLELIDLQEQFDADRLAALKELAALRNTGINDLMQQLGIKPRAVRG